MQVFLDMLFFFFLQGFDGIVAHHIWHLENNLLISYVHRQRTRPGVSFLRVWCPVKEMSTPETQMRYLGRRVVRDRRTGISDLKGTSHPVAEHKILRLKQATICTSAAAELCFPVLPYLWEHPVRTGSFRGSCFCQAKRCKRGVRPSDLGI